MKRRRALLVGVDRYSDAAHRAADRDGRPLPDLDGCVNDVDDVSDLLQCRHGFDVADIRPLRDAEATRDAIEDGLAWLVGGAGPDDPLLFYFSGHGSIYRRPGGSADTMPEFGELLCPHDMDWKTDAFVSDVALRAFVDNRLPDGATLEIVLDACCAGGMSDAARLMAAPEPGTETLPNKFLLPPLAHRASGAKVVPLALHLAVSASPKRCIVWSATGPRGPAHIATLGGRRRSVFTFYWVGGLRPAGSPISRRDLLASVRTSATTHDERQEPELAPNQPAVVEGSFLSGTALPQ